jgi:hypothetical protein
VKDPQDATVLTVRLARAFPSLSVYSSATLAESLCGIERAQRRHAERCCSGESGGYVQWHREPKGAPWPVGMCHPAVARHDPEAEERAGQRIARKVAQWLRRLGELHPDNAFVLDAGRLQVKAGVAWRETVADVRIELQHDPRGAVMLLRLPGEAEGVAV